MAHSKKDIEASSVNTPSHKPQTSTGNVTDKETVKIQTNLGPYEIFLRCIKRAENLVNFHDGKAANEKEEHFDAYRAAIVLSISALDAFVRTLVIEMINEALLKPGKLSKDLYKYLVDILPYEDLIEASRREGFLGIIKEKITTDFQTKSFQGERKITYYMALAGRKKIFYLISKKANTHEDNLIEDIDKFSVRRNNIAHGGDYDINKIPYTEKPIERKYAQDCIKVVSDFAKHLSEICNPISMKKKKI